MWKALRVKRYIKKMVLTIHTCTEKDSFYETFSRLLPLLQWWINFSRFFSTEEEEEEEKEEAVAWKLLVGKKNIYSHCRYLVKIILIYLTLYFTFVPHGQINFKVIKVHTTHEFIFLTSLRRLKCLIILKEHTVFFQSLKSFYPGRLKGYSISSLLILYFRACVFFF